MNSGAGTPRNVSSATGAASHRCGSGWTLERRRRDSPSSSTTPSCGAPRSPTAGSASSRLSSNAEVRARHGGAGANEERGARRSPRGGSTGPGRPDPRERRVRLEGSVLDPRCVVPCGSAEHSRLSGKISWGREHNRVAACHAWGSARDSWQHRARHVHLRHCHDSTGQSWTPEQWLREPSISRSSGTTPHLPTASRARSLLAGDRDRP